MKTLVSKLLRPLAKIVSKDERRQFLTGVHVRQREGSVYFEATDGSRLVRIVEREREGLPSAEEFPVVNGAPDADGQKDAIIPAEAWNAALGAKVFPKRGFMPILQNALLVTGENRNGEEPKPTATFVVTDLAQSAVLPTRLIDGPYPNTDVVLPTDKPKHTFYINAKLFAEVLEALAATVATDAFNMVRVDVFENDKPIRILATDGERYDAVAVIVPLRRPAIEIEEVR